MEKGMVFDIERFAVHDGPGIRTVVFFKGCPLRCPWCANPESQARSPQMGFIESNCIGCMDCTQVCPNAQTFIHTRQPNWEGCSACMECVRVCLAGARVEYGRMMDVEEVVAEVCKDVMFYKNSGGGVTLSGGEACLQPEFAAAVLARCREKGIHTALETCGHIPWYDFEKVLKHVDCLLFDIKHMDTAIHARHIGVGNELILENALKACATVKNMIIRIPVIPGFNESEEHMRWLSEFVSKRLSGVQGIELLPYHSAGESKRIHIGRDAAYMDASKGEPSMPYLMQTKKMMKESGLRISIGG